MAFEFRDREVSGVMRVESYFEVGFDEYLGSGSRCADREVYLGSYEDAGDLLAWFAWLSR